MNEELGRDEGIQHSFFCPKHALRNSEMLTIAVLPNVEHIFDHAITKWQILCFHKMDKIQSSPQVLAAV